MTTAHIEPFRYYLLRKGFAQNTQDYYTRTVTRLLSYYPNPKKAQVEKWLVLHMQEGVNRNTLNTYINAIRTYGKFAKNKPLTKIEFFKKSETVKSTLSESEVKDFLNVSMPYRAFNKERWPMFWTCLCYSGARGSEIASLTKSDIDFGNDEFIITATKTRSVRYVPIAPNIRPMLKRYVDLCPTDKLFPGIVGSAWRRDFILRIKALGIKRHNLSPHSLRHSFLNELDMADVSMRKIQKIAGHSHLETTARYLDSLPKRSLHDAIKMHPTIRKSIDPATILEDVKQGLDKFDLMHDTRFDCKISQSNTRLIIEIDLKGGDK
jgi:integrase/recombinase XerD